MKVKVYTLNAFAKTEIGGNPAGVVLEADHLKENEMQRIAALVGYSETAFIQKSDRANIKISFFTPKEEVDLCGHATVAAFWLLHRQGVLNKNKYTMESKAGLLDIKVDKSGLIFMTQVQPSFLEAIDKNEVVDCLGILSKDIINELPIQIVTTGLKDIIVPIKDLATLLSIKPNFKLISEMSQKYGVIGMHLFTVETMFGSTAHCRNFAPLYEIPEESATGTSNGALSCYLYKYGMLPDERLENIIIEQGYIMKKPSEIYARLTVKQNEIDEIWVGGYALLINETEVQF